MTTILQDNAPPRPTLGTIEASGIKHGARCAKAMLDRPNVPALDVIAKFLAEAGAVNRRFGITEQGRARFLKGFNRGIEVQLANPEASVEVKGI